MSRLQDTVARLRQEIPEVTPTEVAADEGSLILDVREAPHQVKIVLSRTHPDLIKRLFELEVPEVGERIIEIRAMAREAGYRTKVAVSSIDTRVDAVGACVGVRGSRIKNKGFEAADYRLFFGIVFEPSIGDRDGDR